MRLLCARYCRSGAEAAGAPGEGSPPIKDPSCGAPSREYLVRVFVDVDRRPADVITVYLTSKIAKYWKEEE